MNLEAFCYLGLLRLAEQLDPVLALLPEDERTKAKAFLASIRDLPRAEWLRRWSNLRAEEYAAVRRDIRLRSCISIDELPPSLREQWVDWVANQHG